MAFTNLLSSDRLIYEPFDPKDPSTKQFVYQSLLRDVNVSATSALRTLVPHTLNEPGKGDEEWEQRILGNYFRSIICLKPDNWDEISHKVADTQFRGIPIGMLCIFGISQDEMPHGNGTLAISIASEYQGKGYGTEALRYLVDWAFRFGNLHSLRLQARSDNGGGLRAYEKAGFVREGCLREAMYWDGEWFDVIEMSVLRREWEEKRRNGDKK